MLTLFDQEYLTELYGEEQRREGHAEGRAEGRQEGQLIMLYDLVKDGMLSLPAAAARVQQEESEFQAGMDQYFASAG